MQFTFPEIWTKQALELNIQALYSISKILLYLRKLCAEDLKKVGWVQCLWRRYDSSEAPLWSFWYRKNSRISIFQFTFFSFSVFSRFPFPSPPKITPLNMHTSPNISAYRLTCLDSSKKFNYRLTLYHLPKSFRLVNSYLFNKINEKITPRKKKRYV